ncbi:MAG: sigma-70 family RNA polymerase sigma factor [Oscillospiraceae bacterium]|nr:sigma-70 family RNA polymerase sigma factor [Oscillospiraceae bacterium]MBP0988996.1 sigma-70 family RNA polymerase sigma factor [Oscillospiraceae bacterium]
MHDDSRIIALLQMRDEEALQIIKQQYAGLCFQIAHRITGNPEDAEECVNDMLLSVWNTIPPNKPENLRAYLAALTTKNAVNRFKASHRKKRGGEQFLSALDELSEVIPSTDSVEKQFDQRELTAALNAWLLTLQKKQQRLFMQRYLMSESLQRIADQNDMTVSALSMLLQRLRNKLKDYLRKEGLL